MHVPTKGWHTDEQGTREQRIWHSYEDVPNYTPRKLADGRNCCSDSKVLCDECYRQLKNDNLGLTARAAAEARKELGPNYSPKGQPPDPYAPGRAKPLDLSPHLDPSYSPRGEAPDGYAIALEIARQKKEQK